MSEIHEAPIIHGTISVGTFATKDVKLASSSFSAIDSAVDVSSQNPLTNSATKSSLDINKPPEVSAFSFKLVKEVFLNPIGHVSFDYVAQQINTFGNGGEVNGTVTTPTSGTYILSLKSNSRTKSNNLDFSLKVNSSDVMNEKKDGVLSMSTLIFLNSGDIISVHSNNTTQSQTSLEVTLLKSDQTV
jgi:hypothetical protein